jgi:hypothetical protein
VSQKVSLAKLALQFSSVREIPTEPKTSGALLFVIESNYYPKDLLKLV